MKNIQTISQAQWSNMNRTKKPKAIKVVEEETPNEVPCCDYCGYDMDGKVSHNNCERDYRENLFI